LSNNNTVSSGCCQWRNIDWRPLDKLHKGLIPHFEFTEEFIIINYY